MLSHNRRASLLLPRFSRKIGKTEMLRLEHESSRSTIGLEEKRTLSLPLYRIVIRGDGLTESNIKKKYHMCAINAAIAFIICLLLLLTILSFYFLKKIIDFSPLKLYIFYNIHFKSWKGEKSCAEKMHKLRMLKA